MRYRRLLIRALVFVGICSLGLARPRPAEALGSCIICVDHDDPGGNCGAGGCYCDNAGFYLEEQCVDRCGSDLTACSDGGGSCMANQMQVYCGIIE